MMYRSFATVLLGLLVFGLGVSTFADSKAKRTGASELVSMLPGSDGVFVFDSKRFFGESLPTLLSANEPMLAKVTSHIDEFKTRTGIDVRQFDALAAGVTAVPLAAKKYDIDPVIVARGQLSSASLIGAAKVASNGKYREERIGDRLIYIFSAHKAVAQTGQQADVGKMAEVAVTALDDKTLAFGDLDRVRQTVQGKTRVSPELLTMLEKDLSSVAAFAVKTPAGLKAFLPLENDELGKNIDSVRYVYGNADLVAGTAIIHATARTLQSAQAVSLHETLSGLQMFGKAFLGGSKGADKQVYSRLIDNAKFAVKGNEVTFDLTVPQTDIDILVGMIR